MTPSRLAELTWDEAYPDRKPWKDIGKEAQDEWLRVFTIYLRLHYEYCI